MHRTIAMFPAYLQKYCVEQRSNRYSARDHAAWRYIMRQSRAYFKDHAVPISLDGLRRTGVTIERIPSIADMDAKLRELGWGAVPVEGFIPPAAFLDFQARRILPIASDMRSVDHIHYTPAPDIVHEAAGHAPILADPEYSEYLEMYAAMAKKAIFSREDLTLYEAIRTLSDVKENPDCTPAQIKMATSALEQATAAVKKVSEASKVARMNWWTVEYGLIGSLTQPKIYGAGLLSSVGESQVCLQPKVKKLRLSMACVDTSYDITEPQPQLFVAEDIGHLKAVLREFESTLAFRRGGRYGLEQAREGGTVTTTVLDSGLEISGVISDYLSDQEEQVEFVRWQGPVQLCYEGRELTGQSVKEHATGFSTPLGRPLNLPTKPFHLASADDLETIGLKKGALATLRFTTGFIVTGRVMDLYRAPNQQLLYLKWQDCKVVRGEQIYFQPEWGDFDMAVGETVSSVAGGPADPAKYGLHDVGTATTKPGRSSPYSSSEKQLFTVYDEVRSLREQLRLGQQGSSIENSLNTLAKRVSADFPGEWLLKLELVELAKKTNASIVDSLVLDLERSIAPADEAKTWLVRQGLSIAASID